MSPRRVQGKKKIVKEDEEDHGSSNENDRSTIEKLEQRIEGMEFHLQQLREKEYCDVTLRTCEESGISSNSVKESEPIYGHKIVLKSASPYFEDLLGNGIPNQNFDIVVSGIKRTTLDFLLGSIYNCHVGQIDEDNMFDVCAGAKMLQLPAIQEAAKVKIERSRTIENSLQIWTFGKWQECRSLSDPKFILNNFRAVSNTEHFVTLTNEEIEALISSALTRDVKVSTNDLLLSLHIWVKAKEGDQEDVGERTQAFLSLVRKLPRDELDQHIFAQVFLEDHRLRDDPECRKFRDEYLCEFFRKHIQDQKSNGSTSAPTKRQQQQQKQAQKAAKADVPEKVAKVEQPEKPTRINKGVKQDKWEDFDMSPVVKTERSARTQRGRPRRAEPEADASSASSSSADGRSRSTSAASAPTPKKSKKAERSVAPFGSVDGSHLVAYYTTNKGGDWFINSYDFQTGESRRVANFLHYRENGVLLIVNKFIYFLGGRSLYGSPGERVGEDSTKIDTFDMTTGEWNCSGDLLEMDEGRCYFNCAVLNGKIYIVAGFREDACIDSVERIPIVQPNVKVDLDEEEVTNVKWAKNRSPLAVLNGKIYSVGGVVAEGNSNAWASSFVECYDPTTNKWTSVARMQTQRVGHCVAVVGGKLYAIGGGKSEETLESLKINSVEVYDPKTNKWTAAASMHKKRQFGCAVTFAGYIFVLGGDSHQKPTAEKYDSTSDTWEMVDKSCLPPSDADYSSMIFEVRHDSITIE